MRNQPETQHIYNIPRLNKVFLLSSVLALITTVWMIYFDWNREWKHYQRQNKVIEAQKARQDLDQARQRARESLERLDAELKAQQAAVARQQAELQAAQRELEKADVALSNADVAFKFAKADLDAMKSAYEMELHEASLAIMRVKQVGVADAVREARAEARIEKHARQLAEQGGRVRQLDDALQAAQAVAKAAGAKVSRITSGLRGLEKDRARLLLEQDKAQKRIESLKPSLAKAVLDAPLMESFQPSLKVDQKILDHQRVNLNFVEVPRVDRCMTCHVNMDKRAAYPTIVSSDPDDNRPFKSEDLEDLLDKGKEKGWLDYAQVQEFVTANLKIKKGLTAAQVNSIMAALQEAGVEYRDFYRKLETPFFSHPRLDLFVGSTSPHPVEKFGCTSCHWGWDRDVRFVDAAHTPDASRQVKVAWTNEPSPWLAALGMTGSKQTFEGNQRDYWKARYHWHEIHDLDQKMRPAKFTEASCLKCHRNVTEVPAADKLNRGLRLVDQAGCWSCHRIRQLEHTVNHKTQADETIADVARLYNVDTERIRLANNLMTGEPKPGQVLGIPVRKLQRTGPALTKVAGKLSHEWIRKWLADPKAFRPNTFMPRFWGLDNNSEKISYPGVRLATIKASDRNEVEMDAIAAFVNANAEAPRFTAPPVPGDAKRGHELFDKVGCYGCHVTTQKLDELKADPRRTPGMSDAEYRRLRSQGPMLAGVGSKAGEGWLYAWLKDPKQFSPQTRMPKMRLTDQEAADVTAFLMTLKNGPFEKRQVGDVKTAVLDDVTEEYLRGMLPYREAAEIAEARRPLDPVLKDALKGIWSDQEIKDRLASLDAAGKKKLFLGVKLVSQYGCYSCHQMKGFETAKPIGTELSEWGSKATAKLDFGYLEKKIEHNNYAYLSQKLRSPRSFDRTDTRAPQEWLRMPQFDFTESQIEDIVTAIMGMTDERIPAEGRRNLTTVEDRGIEDGRWLAQQYNCQGCHVLERKGGAIRSKIEDPAFYPPDLFAQGARTQPEWLFKFLKNPDPIRPRLFANARMPSFGFSDEQINVLLRYFNYLDRQDFPFDASYILARHTDPKVLQVGQDLFQRLQCVKCHNLKPGQTLDPQTANQQFPSLVLVRERLKPKWVTDWLRDPNFFQKGTQMPAFWPEGSSPFPDILGGKAEDQMQAVTEYLYEYKGEDLGQAAAPAAPAKPASNVYE